MWQDTRTLLEEMTLCQSITTRQKRGYICLIMSWLALDFFLRDFACSLLATTRIVRPQLWILKKGVVYLEFPSSTLSFSPVLGPGSLLVTNWEMMDGGRGFGSGRVRNTIGSVVLSKRKVSQRLCDLACLDSTEISSEILLPSDRPRNVQASVQHLSTA